LENIFKNVTIQLSQVKLCRLNHSPPRSPYSEEIQAVSSAERGMKGKDQKLFYSPSLQKLLPEFTPK
jgi:hypothetical protein